MDDAFYLLNPDSDRRNPWSTLRKVTGEMIVTCPGGDFPVDGGDSG